MTSPRPVRPLRRRGASLTEVMIASSISALVLATVMAAFLAVVRAERDGLIDQAVLTQANRVERRLQILLRSLSREAGVTFGSPDGVWFREIFVRETSTGPVQRIWFDDDGRLFFDRNLAVADDEEQFGGPGTPGASRTRLRDGGFRFTFAPDGAVDTGLVVVTFTIDDDGVTSGERDAGDGYTGNSIVKTFAVRLRGA